MGNAGGDYVFRNGYMWAWCNGKWSYAGTYEQVSIDSPQINFVMMVQTAGVLADRWLRENAKEMAIGSALSGVGGVVSGALSGGLAVGGTAGASGVTDLAVVTAKGARYANYATKLTAREFQSNLLAIGYKIVRQGISSNGPFTGTEQRREDVYDLRGNKYRRGECPGKSRGANCQQDSPWRFLNRSSESLSVWTNRSRAAAPLLRMPGV